MLFVLIVCNQEKAEPLINKNPTLMRSWIGIFAYVVRHACLLNFAIKTEPKCSSILNYVAKVSIFLLLCKKIIKNFYLFFINLNSKFSMCLIFTTFRIDSNGALHTFGTRKQRPCPIVSHFLQGNHQVQLAISFQSYGI